VLEPILFRVEIGGYGPILPEIGIVSLDLEEMKAKLFVIRQYLNIIKYMRMPVDRHTINNK
jgi:hypothetical protein